MTHEPLSQAEIDSLFGAAAPAEAPEPSQLAKALEAYLRRGFAVSDALLGEAAELSAFHQQTEGVGAALASLGGPALVGQLPFSQGFAGSLYLVLSASGATQLVQLLYGSEEPPQLDEMAQGALAEILGQVLASGLTDLADAVGRTLVGDPVTVKPAEGSQVADLGLSSQVEALHFTLAIAGQSHPLILLVPQALAKQMEQQISLVAASPGAQAQPTPAAAPASPASAPATPPVNVQAVAMRELGQGQAQTEPRNIELLLDVNLSVTVELGRTRRQIRDILGLGKGSVIELDRLAGEAVDVLVNGKLIAKGEVVVIDENFGVRVTDIVSPLERVNSLR